MLRKTPPLAAAEAFLAAAGAPSFRAAADELALSPSAFSRRIQMLERFVDAPLFDRSGPSIALTAKGRAYRDAIAPALGAIREATAQMRGEGSEPLRVSASPSFAIDWLMPRLANLREQADIALELVVSTGVQSLRVGDADLAIVGGDSAPADFPSERLIALDGVLTAAPRLANGRARPQGIEELGQHELLAMKTPPHLWHRWLTDLGHPALEPRTDARFESLHLMYEAAANGLGLILATPLAAERYLRDGRLSPCLPQRRPIGMDYRLVQRTPEVARRPSAQRFRAWLDTEIAASCRLFDAHAAAA